MKELKLVQPEGIQNKRDESLQHIGRCTRPAWDEIERSHEGRRAGTPCQESRIRRVGNTVYDEGFLNRETAEENVAGSGETRTGRHRGRTAVEHD